MNFVLPLFVFLQFFSVNGKIEKLQKCGGSITSAAASPAPASLKDLEGFWYIYQTNTPARWFSDILCGKCVLQAKSATEGTLKCSMERRVLDPQAGKITYKQKFYTLKLKYTSATATIAFSGGSVNYDLLIIKWDNAKKCQIALAFCDYINVGGIIEIKAEVQIALVRKLPLPATSLITAPATDIEHKECKSVEFDPTAVDGIIELAAPTTDRPSKDIPTKCSNLTFTEVDSRWVKFYPTKKTWQKAKDWCACQGYNLARADSKAIVDAIKAMGIKEDAWIGLTHKSQAADVGTYEWCPTATSAATELKVNSMTGAAIPSGAAMVPGYTGFAAAADYDKTGGKDAKSCFVLPNVETTPYGWTEKLCTETLGFYCECVMCP